MGAVGRKRIREIALTEFGVRSIIENYCTDRKSLIYVTHYEHEIPPVIDKRLRLVKKL